MGFLADQYPLCIFHPGLTPSLPPFNQISRCEGRNAHWCAYILWINGYNKHGYDKSLCETSGGTSIGACLSRCIRHTFHGTRDQCALGGTSIGLALGSGASGAACARCPGHRGNAEGGTPIGRTSTEDRRSLLSQCKSAQFSSSTTQSLARFPRLCERAENLELMRRLTAFLARGRSALSMRNHAPSYSNANEDQRFTSRQISKIMETPGGPWTG
jgi:hypothetical protein